MSVLRALGAHLANASVTAPTRARLALHLLDGLGALLAGAGLPEAARLRALFADRNDAEARLIVRVGSMRAGEIDDIHTASATTAAAVILPVLLSQIAARANAGAAPRADDIAAAMQAGYGAMSWLGEALGGPRLLAQGIWPTYLLAPLGAAATAARLWRLDPTTTAHALAIALCRISGGPGRHGGATDDATTPRWLLLGEAARAGLAAVTAAACGYQADLGLLDDDWITRVHAITPVNLAAPMAADGGVDGLSLKPVAAAKQTLAALDGFRALAVPPEAIAGVRVGVPAQFVEMIGHCRTHSRTDRLISLPYLLSLAAHAPAELDDFARSLAPDATMTRFMQSVEVRADDQLTSLFPRYWPASVRIDLRGGGSRQMLVRAAPGDPSRPLGEAEILAKFTRLLAGCATSAQTGALAEAALASLEDDTGGARLLAALAEIGFTD